MSTLYSLEAPQFLQKDYVVGTHYKHFCFSTKIYVVGTHSKCLAEALLMSTNNIGFNGEIRQLSVLFS